jgi:hypothetical protein
MIKESQEVRKLIIVNVHLAQDVVLLINAGILTKDEARQILEIDSQGEKEKQ